MSSSFPSTKLELFAHSAGRNEAFDERVLHINSGIYNIVTSLLAQHGKVVAHFVAKLDALLKGGGGQQTVAGGQIGNTLSHLIILYSRVCKKKIIHTNK